MLFIPCSERKRSLSHTTRDSTQGARDSRNMKNTATSLHSSAMANNSSLSRSTDTESVERMVSVSTVANLQEKYFTMRQRSFDKVCNG